jgi:hypothetical protein
MLIFDVMLPCRPVVVPQDNLVAPTSPSRMRSPDLKVVGEALADDVQTATPLQGAAESREASPPVENTMVASPLRAVEAGEGTSVGDVGVTTSPRIIDVDPISPRPAGAEDLIKDQPQIDQVPRGLGTSGAQVPESSSSIPRLPQWEINCNGTPWQDDIFEGSEDVQALRTSIVTINHALMVSLLFDVLFLLMFCWGAANELAVLWQSLAEQAKSGVNLLNNATEREQQITDLEQELKHVRQAAATENKRLEDELAEGKRKATEATSQFNTLSIGRSGRRIDDLVVAVAFVAY